jgi:hypothetical protein
LVSSNKQELLVLQKEHQAKIEGMRKRGAAVKRKRREQDEELALIMAKHLAIIVGRKAELRQELIRIELEHFRAIKLARNDCESQIREYQNQKKQLMMNRPKKLKISSMKGINVFDEEPIPELSLVFDFEKADLDDPDLEGMRKAERIQKGFEKASERFLSKINGAFGELEDDCQDFGMYVQQERLKLSKAVSDLGQHNLELSRAIQESRNEVEQALASFPEFQRSAEISSRPRSRPR